MTISSRAPEGEPNRCDCCGKALRIDPSSDTRDAPCPHCGVLMWFSQAPGRPPESVFKKRAEWLVRTGTERFGELDTVTQALLATLSDAATILKFTTSLPAARDWDELFALAFDK